MVKFIKYDADGLSWCKGKLIVELNGKVVKFGYGIDCDYEPFWESGGEIIELDDGRLTAVGGPWKKETYTTVPVEIEPYIDELINCMNENIEYGCCGGCI